MTSPTAPATAPSTAATTPEAASTAPVSPQDQRDGLLDAQREANRQQPRNFKDDALHEKIVSVEPDGTGPTPTETFDPADDQHGR